MPFSQWVLSLLSEINGFVASEVNLTALAKDVVLAELGSPGFKSAIEACIKDADHIFVDPTFRPLAVEALKAALLLPLA